MCYVTVICINVFFMSDNSIHLFEVTDYAAISIWIFTAVFPFSGQVRKYLTHDATLPSLQ